MNRQIGDNMADRLFGTDGIRGKVNKGAIRPANFVRFGEALATVLRTKGVAMPRVLIGRDTRQSGLMIESAILSGLVNAGANAELVGILPTPAVGYLTRSTGCDAGLMITASHNPPTDNGVKVFGADGFKLSSHVQDEIEALIQSDEELSVSFEKMGQISSPANSYDDFLAFAKRTVSLSPRWSKLKICLDAAHGAGFKLAHELLQSTGAKVIASGISPDGANINVKCGALHTEALQEAVKSNGADIGIALDGDADRLIVVDETGAEIDGDQLMGALALDYHAQGKLKGDTLVATIMSNLGLELKLKSAGIRLERTKVGDRYVVERMREGGFNVGGEQSGHIVLTDFVTTGDAIISALQVIDIMVRKSQTASEVMNVFEPVPQVLKNVSYGDADPLETQQVKDSIAAAEIRLGEQGRIVIRKSGTEPVIRVMAEAQSLAAANAAVDSIIADINAVCGQ